MKSKKVTRYYAECGKGFWKKSAALAHEENCLCWKNPKNKTCKTCEHADMVAYESDTGYGGFYECYHPDNKTEAHAGAPKGIDYLSVNCYYYEDKLFK
jgi:hypothetical protein